MTTEKLSNTLIDEGINEMNEGVDSCNPYLTNDGIVKVFKALGIKPLFKTMDDFDEFMSNPDRKLVL